jgi:hypothetical protein
LMLWVHTCLTSSWIYIFFLVWFGLRYHLFITITIEQGSILVPASTSAQAIKACFYH